MSNDENRDSEVFESNFIEKRKTERKKLIVDVHFEGGEATGIANTTDISIGGLFLRTNAEFEIGGQILMRLTFGGKEIILNGIVIYSEYGKGFGINFQNLTGEKEAILRKELDL